MKLKLKDLGNNRYELDVRGKTCPFPQVFTNLALEKVKSSVLEVITDNPPSVRDVPLGLEKKGYKVETKKENNHWRLVVKNDS